MKCVQAGWNEWGKNVSGVLYDRKVSARISGRLCISGLGLPGVLPNKFTLSIIHHGSRITLLLEEMEEEDSLW